jgi:hypothetical protein
MKKNLFFLFALILLSGTVMALDIKIISESHGLTLHEVIFEADASLDPQDVFKNFDFNILGVSPSNIVISQEVQTQITEIVSPAVIECVTFEETADKNGSVVCTKFQETQPEVTRLVNVNVFEPLTLQETKKEVPSQKDLELIVDDIESKIDVNEKTVAITPAIEIKAGQRKRFKVTWKTPIEVTGRQLNTTGQWALNPSNWWNLNYDRRIPVRFPTPHNAITGIDTVELRNVSRTLLNCTDNNRMAIIYQTGSTKTELSADIVGNCATQDVNIFFRAQFGIPAATSFTTTDTNGYYIYLTDSNVSNPDRNAFNVYRFYDNFEDGNVSNWTTVTDGLCLAIVSSATDQAAVGTYSMKIQSLVSCTTGRAEASVPSDTYNYAGYFRSTIKRGFAGQGQDDTAGSARIGFNEGTDFVVSVAAATSGFGVSSANTWYYGEFQTGTGDANGIVYNTSNVALGSGTRTGAPTDQSIIFASISSASGAVSSWFDNMKAWAAYEGTWSLGAEENLNADINYGNYVTSSGINYVRALNYDINYTCLTGQIGSASLRVNAVNVQINSLTCNGTSRNLSNSYSRPTDGNTTVDVNYTLGTDSNFLAPIQMTWDLNSPRIQNFDINATTGFGSTGRLNYRLRCTDTISPIIDYNLTNNSVSQYSSIDTNNETVYLNNLTLNNGSNLILFRCTDLIGNTVTDTNTFTGFLSLFYLVYADTGIGLTGQADYNAADINSFKVYSIALNQYLDLKASGDVNITYSGTGEDGIVFVATYTNPARPAVIQDFDLGALDSNSIPVCFSRLQPFYEQLFYSTSVRTLKIKHASTGCHDAIAYTDYAYLDGFKLSVYTIPSTYELYYRPADSNTYILLSLLSGNFAAQHNIDLMIINSEPNPEIIVSTDTLTAKRYCQVADCNVLSVSYTSPQTNSSVVINILNGSTILTTTTVTGADSNNINFTWNFTDQNINADFLTLRATITRSDGTIETIEELFTLRGIQVFLDPGIAILIAFSLFFFVFTLVAARFSLGWIGIIACILSLAILSAAPATQMILVSQVIFITVGAVIFFTWKNETAKAI